MMVAAPRPMRLRRARQVRERDERLDERPVRAFHAVGMEHQVVAHPDGVEAQALGEADALDEQVLVGLLAEVREQQPETHRHG